jgi:hypothetical protein
MPFQVKIMINLLIKILFLRVRLLYANTIFIYELFSLFILMQAEHSQIYPRSPVLHKEGSSPRRRLLSC